MISQPDSQIKRSDDQELWEKVRKGDKKAYGCIYQKYFPELYRYGMTIQPDQNMVGDAIQELFTDLWTQRCSLSEVRKLRLYLIVSLRSRIYKFTSKNARKNLTEKEYSKDSIQFLDSTEENWISIDDAKIKKEQLVLLINDLPTLQREAIMLIFFEERSYEEASSLMSKSIQNVYTLVSRGISSLRKKLA